MNNSLQFYVEKLGFQLASRAINQEEGEEYAFLTFNDLRLELIQDLKKSAFPKPAVKPPYCPHLALETDDMQSTVANLKARQVSILRGPLAIEGEETWLYFTDPDNNMLEFIQWFKHK